MKRHGFILLWLWCLCGMAAEVIPPSPAHYFNDYAHVVNPGTADQLNLQLDSFERSTGNQVVVAIYPKMQSDSSIDDYAVRVFRAWKVGQKGKNNGVVLFVFIDDRKMFIEVGYGLEGALPDAVCKQITEYEIKPHFKTGDYTGGLVVGVNDILAATRGEFKGNGTTVFSRNRNGGEIDPGTALLLFIGILVFIFIMSRLSRGRHGWVITSGGWGGGGWGGGGWGGGGWGGGGWGGGGWGGGGGGGGFSGGGFSGGGGSSGGGGAGSSW